MPDRKGVYLDHIAIAVTDLDKAIHWYCQCLGCEVLERRLTKGSRTAMISAVLKAGSSIIVLIQGTSPESQVSRFVDEFGPGVQHVAFAVDDINLAIENVKKAGGESAIDMIEGDGIRQIFLRRDPGSGVRIELIERHGGSFNDKSVEQLFRAFEAKNLY